MTASLFFRNSLPKMSGKISSCLRTLRKRNRSALRAVLYPFSSLVKIVHVRDMSHINGKNAEVAAMKALDALSKVYSGLGKDGKPFKVPCLAKAALFSCARLFGKKPEFRLLLEHHKGNGVEPMPGEICLVKLSIGSILCASWQR